MVKTKSKLVAKKKMTLKEEKEKADSNLRNEARKHIRKNYPDITDQEFEEVLDLVVPLIIKAIYNADTEAATKVWNMAFGEPK